MALLRSSLLIAFIAGTLVPVMAGAQWTVKVYSTMNPLPIGACAAVRLEVINPESRDVPRRPGGERVTIADFDIVMGGGSVAPQWIDAYHLNACGCQSGTVGGSAVITATYPAAALPEHARVAGVSVQAKGDVSLGKAQNTSNPPSCATASVAPRVVVAAAGVKPVIAPAKTTTPTPFSTAPAAAPVRPSAPSPVAAAPTNVSTLTAGGVAIPPEILAAWARLGIPASADSTYGTTIEELKRMLNDWLTASGALTASSALTPAPGTIAGARVPLATTSGRPAPPAPTPVNPSGFAAVQTGLGKIKLSWQPVSGVSYYVLMGPGLPAGGTRVAGTTSGSGLGGTIESRGGVLGVSSSSGTVAPPVDYFTTTFVEAGYREWAVASYYEPGPVSTDAAAFSRVELNVSPPFADRATGFAATQTGSGQVRFSWQPLDGATAYRLMGPGLPAGGANVAVVAGRASGTSGSGSNSIGTVAAQVEFTATAIPAGPGVWHLTGVYGPLTVMAEVYAEVKLNVTPPINPSNFAFTQLGPGQVRFSWKPVDGVAYYRLLGPGLPIGGMKVDPGYGGGTSGSGVARASSNTPSSTTNLEAGGGSLPNASRIVAEVVFIATAVPSGPGMWHVGSYFGPAPVSTPEADFPMVFRVVKPPTNPTRFAAVQTGSGQVRFSWEPVSQATYYVLIGPGLPGGRMRIEVDGGPVMGGDGVSSNLSPSTATANNDGGILIPNNAVKPSAPLQPAGTVSSVARLVAGQMEFTATTIPAGPGLWYVGSYFGPSAVSTSLSDFPKVAVNVKPPINPSGFSAVETGPGEVVFSWLPVTGVSYYVLMGPGLPYGGVRVGPDISAAGMSRGGSGSIATAATAATAPKVAFLATGIPGGPGVWQVGSYFGPEPVSTPEADFPSVALNVSLTKK